MEEKKLTDEELVDEFEHFVKYGLCREKITLVDILDLIHRLQENNANQVRMRCDMQRKFDDLQNLCTEQKAEIERLTEREKFLENAWHISLENANTLDIALNASRAREQEYKKQVDELKEERENMQAEIIGLESQKEDLYFQNQNLQSYIDNHEPIWKRNTEQAVKDTAKKFADLVEFHSISRRINGVEYFTISILGLKEILTEEFGFKWSELDEGVEVE